MQVPLLVPATLLAQMSQTHTLMVNISTQSTPHTKSRAKSLTRAVHHGPGMTCWTPQIQAASSQLLPPMIHPLLTRYLTATTAALAQTLLFWRNSCGIL